MCIHCMWMTYVNCRIEQEVDCQVKGDLANSFDMKDLGPTQQILGMTIVLERTSKMLWISWGTLNMY